MAHGHKAICKVIEEQRNNIINHRLWTGIGDESGYGSAKRSFGPEAVTCDTLALPSLTKPLNEYNIDLNNRSLVTVCGRSTNGGCGHPGWGKEGRKRVWWPQGVAWTKDGVKRGVTVDQL